MTQPEQQPRSWYKQRFQQLYDSGASIDRIASICGVTGTTAYHAVRRLQSHGIVTALGYLTDAKTKRRCDTCGTLHTGKDCGSCRRSYEQKKAERREYVGRLFEAGITPTDAAKVFGVAKPGVFTLHKRWLETGQVPALGMRSDAGGSKTITECPICGSPKTHVSQHCSDCRRVLDRAATDAIHAERVRILKKWSIGCGGLIPTTDEAADQLMVSRDTANRAVQMAFGRNDALGSDRRVARYATPTNDGAAHDDRQAAVASA